jgi:hypothetical protein
MHEDIGVVVVAGGVVVAHVVQGVERSASAQIPSRLRVLGKYYRRQYWHRGGTYLK